MSTVNVPSNLSNKQQNVNTVLTILVVLINEYRTIYTSHLIYYSRFYREIIVILQSIDLEFSLDIPVVGVPSTQKKNIFTKIMSICLSVRA